MRFDARLRTTRGCPAAGRAMRTGPSSTRMTPTIWDGSAIDAYRFSTSTSANWFVARSRSAAAVRSSSAKGSPAWSWAIRRISASSVTLLPCTCTLARMGPCADALVAAVADSITASAVIRLLRNMPTDPLLLEWSC